MDEKYSEVSATAILAKQHPEFAVALRAYREQQTLSVLEESDLK